MLTIEELRSLCARTGVPHHTSPPAIVAAENRQIYAAVAVTRSDRPGWTYEGLAHLDAHYRDTPAWRADPFGRLELCAEADALRRAFDEAVGFLPYEDDPIELLAEVAA
ncbi:MAG: hypothetical protein JWO31_553 [Phycisphaerales bacterium]|nr:hypothetical protein [Phycisphaerales bacterium]